MRIDDIMERTRCNCNFSLKITRQNGDEGRCRMKNERTTWKNHPIHREKKKQSQEPSAPSTCVRSWVFVIASLLLTETEIVPSLEQLLILFEHLHWPGARTWRAMLIANMAFDGVERRRRRVPAQRTAVEVLLEMHNNQMLELFIDRDRNLALRTSVHTLLRGTITVHPNGRLNERSGTCEV